MTHIGPTTGSGHLHAYTAGPAPKPVEAVIVTVPAQSTEIVPGQLTPTAKVDAGAFDFEAGLAKLPQPGMGQHHHHHHEGARPAMGMGESASTNNGGRTGGRASTTSEAIRVQR
ncbi:MAG: hypothetical protein JWM80_645 [Cyanobacteria bacterium RYN_339]|nr:hypothetical protein [Cyanobacteria bacterium RYN_339]